MIIFSAQLSYILYSIEAMAVSLSWIEAQKVLDGELNPFIKSYLLHGKK